MSDELGSGALSQDEVEALIRSHASAPKAPKPAATPSPGPSAGPPLDAPRYGDDVELLLAQAEQAIASVDSPRGSAVPGLSPYELRAFGGSPPSEDRTTIELLRDVELDLTIELGRTQMCLEEVLKLRKGAVVPLDKLAGDPVEILVNGRLIARGEVLVLNDNFCVRVGELVTSDKK